MATANEMNGIPHPPETTTLNDLLKDDKFGVEESTMSNEEYNQGQLYQQCLSSFIRGDPKDCLEKMYEFGFLVPQVLIESNQAYALFQGACDAIKNFNNLGTSLQKVVRTTFTGDTNRLKNHFNGKPRSVEIAILNRYYRCCAKVLQMDSIPNGSKISYLETELRNDIDRHSNEPLFQDSESIIELQQLAETYIFHIQIGLMHKPISPYLYHGLCESVSGLSENLNKSIGNDKTIEQRILQRLESKQRKSKKPTNITNSSPPHPDTATIEKHSLPPKSPEQDHQEHQQGQRQQLQATPKWLNICYRYISKFEVSRQTLLIALLLFFLSARKIKGISRIPHYIVQSARSTMPYLRNLLRVLSSI